MDFLKYDDEEGDDFSGDDDAGVAVGTGYAPEKLRPELVQTSFNTSLPLAVFAGVPSSSSGIGNSSSSSSLNPFQRKRGNVVDTSLNLPAELMYAPLAGPHAPNKNPNNGAFGISKIEFTSVAEYTFREQHNSFASTGHAIDCTTGAVLGAPAPPPRTTRPRGAPTKRRRVEDVDLDAGDDGLAGPWAEDATTLAVKERAEAAAAAKEATKAKEEEAAAAAAAAAGENGDDDEAEDGGRARASAAAAANVHVQEPDADAEKWEKVNERKMSYLLPPRPSRGTEVEEAKSTFHGQALVDYQGRPWWQAPSGVRADGGDHACYVPKKCVKQYTGHTKGVQAIEFFPGTGHLLLSGSLDGKCKVWDVMGDRNVKRTYAGHTEGVRSIHMSNVGTEFLSSGFDRLIRLWDLETGQAKGTFSNRKMGYQVKFYPNDNNVFLVAASDNRIYQWDVRTGAVCQEYNYHLQPVNTITFFDNGRKFASTSDDKKILVWEYDIPVPIKYISEPGMHSVPSVTPHPSGNFFAGQSLDNTIVVYQVGDKFRQLKKRTFTGHNNSGYACQIGFSANGQYMVSGDGLGKLHAWDWKTGKAMRKFQAHEGGPCIGAVWSPLQPNLVATCGWDGLVKLWE